MHRFFVLFENINGITAVIQGDDAHHIQKVLRLRIGEEIVLCDGRGNDHTASIDFIGKGQVTAVIKSSAATATEPRTKVTLVQGVPKASKMEAIIQKCVELGVHNIVPANTLRAVVRFDDERDSDKKAQRWQRIAEEAAKQSRRGIIPHVSSPLSFEEAVKSSNSRLKLLLWEEEREQSLRSVLRGFAENEPAGKGRAEKLDSIAILIGPEGGLDAKEAALARNHGWIPVSVGPRILRTETAGMAVLAAIMYQMEDMEWRQHP
jgi:16S rRNA (uracil1498-N3)-methyltransferase